MTAYTNKPTTLNNIRHYEIYDKQNQIKNIPDTGRDEFCSENLSVTKNKRMDICKEMLQVIRGKIKQ
jgi:hypothetical protein